MMDNMLVILYNMTTTLYSRLYAHNDFEVDPRIMEISLVKPKNNRKQASLERFPKFLGKPSKSCRKLLPLDRLDDSDFTSLGGGEEEHVSF